LGVTKLAGPPADSVPVYAMIYPPVCFSDIIALSPLRQHLYLFMVRFG